jgi:cobalt/nickel transport system permease protein
MNNIGRNSFDIGNLDTLAAKDGWLQRLDPRAKLITTMLFIVIVVSFDRYAFSSLLPFFIYPVVLMSLGDLPAGYLWRKVLVVSPFALLVGIFNPFLDRAVMYHVNGLGISAGWVSFGSILLRFLLTVSAALILVSSTGFSAVCWALKKLGLPRVFVMQLLFFYRYIFVLTDESERAVRAGTMRGFRSQSIGFKGFVSLIGTLLLRTLGRAERIYSAMCSRGFNGQIRIIRTMHTTSREWLFVFCWVSLFLLFRVYNIPLLLGKVITGVIQ